MKNKPYVKEHKNGIWSNPIEGQYLNLYPNRKQRREHLQGRDFSNKKGIQLVVTYIGNGKFWKSYKRIQTVCIKYLRTKKGVIIGIEEITPKQIIHYDGKA